MLFSIRQARKTLSYKHQYKLNALTHRISSNNILFRKVKSDVGNYEFCKILCRNGHWRGPVCRVEIDDIKGKERISNLVGGLEDRG